MKILISAYSCEPHQGSEPGVGWNVAREVAKYHQVWVLTRPDESGKIIESELARNPVPNLHFVYFNIPILGRMWKLGGSSGILHSAAMQIHYYLWQIAAFFVAKRLHAKISFDIAHHVTFVKYSYPSFLPLLSIPFVWGPVGGGESAPKSFWQDFSPKAKVFEILRNSVRWLSEKDPFVHLTAKRSAVVRATTEDTAQRLYKMGVNRVQIVSEAGLSDQDISIIGQYPMPDYSAIRFISMGRLLHWKGFHLGLRAFAQAGLPDAEYWILGDGPELPRLQLLASNLGIASQVKFWGRLPRDETLSKLGESHVLVHPSLHDSGGWVCMEAMAAGRPIICLDLGGPAIQVTQETGFKIPAHNPHQAVRDLSQAMIQLAQNPQLHLKMGAAGSKRVREVFSWEVKGHSLAQLYEKVGYYS